MTKQRRVSGRPAQQEVRIIGGEWRRRRIAFADLPGLRPTPDRVRETLFNWLQPLLPGCRVLDLFAGSGCLGFEALSRGAAMATLVDSVSQAVRDLQLTQQSLGADRAEILQVDALQLLRAGPAQPYDLVFVDPPYQLQLYEPVLQLLIEQPWLAPGACIYVERELQQALTWPKGWTVHRELAAGNLVATLLRCL